MNAWSHWPALLGMLETVLAAVIVVGLRFLWRYYRHRADWWRDDEKGQRL